MVHRLVAKFVYAFGFQEVLQFTDEVDWQLVNAFEARAFEEGNDVEGDELQRVDLKLLHLLHVGVLKEVKSVVDGEVFRENLHAVVGQRRDVVFKLYFFSRCCLVSAAIEV